MYMGKQIYMLMGVGAPRGEKIVDLLELELQELWAT